MTAPLGQEMAAGMLVDWEEDHSTHLKAISILVVAEVLVTRTTTAAGVEVSLSTLTALMFF